MLNLQEEKSRTVTLKDIKLTRKDNNITQNLELIGKDITYYAMTSK